jgi:hypothetical protein
MSEYHNEGLTIFNSTISGPLAAGRDARAVQYNGSTPNAADGLIGELRALIRANERILAEAQPALRDLDDIAAELRHPQPDAARLRDTLGRLAGRMTPVPGAAGLTVELDQLIGGIRGG